MGVRRRKMQASRRGKRRGKSTSPHFPVSFGVLPWARAGALVELIGASLILAMIVRRTDGIVFGCGKDLPMPAIFQ